MNKLSITIDLAKIDKNRIVERKYTNKEGLQCIAKEYKIEAIALKEPKQIATGSNWTMNKTHFIVDAQTKEERQAKVKSRFVGDGFQFTNNDVDYNAMVNEVVPDDSVFNEPVGF